MEKFIKFINDNSEALKGS